MVDRIKQVMDYEGLTPAVFAETIGINRSNLTHIFSGRNQPSLDLAKKILTAFPEIKTEWLIMGMGEMLDSPENKVESAKPTARFVQTDLFSGETPDTPAQPVAHQTIPENQSTASENHRSERMVHDSKPNKDNVEVETQKSIPSRRTTRNVANIPTETPKRQQKINSQEVKTVQKIVFFYSDNTFETFYPQH